MMDEPKIKVGICDDYPEIRGRLNGVYRTNGSSLTGEFTARPREGAIGLYDAFDREILRTREIHLLAEGKGTFTLHEVTIGVRFHWERREEQTFAGDLMFLPSGKGTLVAVNEISVEEYLMSVVSSEMNGEAPFAFLKAHAIASRSWLVAMLSRSKEEKGDGREEHNPERRGGRPLVRSRGPCPVRRLRRRPLPAVSGDIRPGVREGGGGRPGDAGRFPDPRGKDLRRPLPQGMRGVDREFRDLLGGDIRSLSLPCFRFRKAVCPRPDGGRCGAVDPLPPRCLLPHAGSGSPPAYSSRIRPGDGRFFPLAGQLRKRGVGGDSEEKSGIDFGVLHNLVPLERGPSGRIRLLRIEGSKSTVVVGKELEIRRWLSPSHLYSSAFIVCTTRDPSGIPVRFTLFGAGWGHGVGLCQIGAAVMAEKGYTAEEILRHYFRGAALVKRY